jgi:DNA mismatch repair ATPase MutS
MDMEKIQDRLEKVAELKEKDLPRKAIRDSLRQVRDLERLSATFPWEWPTPGTWWLSAPP